MPWQARSLRRAQDVRKQLITIMDRYRYNNATHEDATREGICNTWQTRAMQPPQSPLNAKQSDCIGLHCRMSLGQFAMRNSRAAPCCPEALFSAESESESFACVGFAAVLFVLRRCEAAVGVAVAAALPVRRRDDRSRQPPLGSLLRSCSTPVRVLLLF
jgi:hypothetical protein